MELRAERINPLQVDADIIDTARDSTTRKATKVFDKQSFILESKKNSEDVAENHFFNLVMERSVGGKRVILSEFGV